MFQDLCSTGVNLQLNHILKLVLSSLVFVEKLSIWLCNLLACCAKSEKLSLFLLLTLLAQFKLFCEKMFKNVGQKPVCQNLTENKPDLELCGLIHKMCSVVTISCKQGNQQINTSFTIIKTQLQTMITKSISSPGIQIPLTKLRVRKLYQTT